MSPMDVKSTLKVLLRFESQSIIRETAEKTDDQKLLVLEFLVRAFSLVGDIESCLALRYEALNFRELKSFNQQWLQVSHAEWLNFAEHSLHAGFSSIAIKAYEQALSSLQQSDTANYTSDGSFKRTEVIEKIKRLKDHALKSAGSNSGSCLLPLSSNRLLGILPEDQKLTAAKLYFYNWESIVETRWQNKNASTEFSQFNSDSSHRSLLSILG